MKSIELFDKSFIQKVLSNLRQPSRLLALILLLILFVSGVVLAVTSNYGSDNDTYGMLRTYLQLKNGQGYVPSRFTGYPVAEIGIGFIAYYFGSWLNNLVSFLFFIVAAILIYRSLTDNKINFSFITFLILILSNPVLFFDNIAPMDYSWSLLFFSLGLYFLKEKEVVLTTLFFGISIGTRPNFLIFCAVAIIFFKHEVRISNSAKMTMMFATAFIGSLFYIPIWFNSGLGFEWLTAARPLGQGYQGLIARFVYKSWMATGLFVLPLAVYLLNKFRSRLTLEKNIKVIQVLIISNLLIYLYIPADRSYLQLSLVLILFLISLNFSRVLGAVVVLNLISWFVYMNPISIIFKSNNPCDFIEAVDVKLEPNLSKGELFLYKEGQQEFTCYQDDILNNYEKLKLGSKLR